MSEQGAPEVPLYERVLGTLAFHRWVRAFQLPCSFLWRESFLSQVCVWLTFGLVCSKTFGWLHSGSLIFAGLALGVVVSC